MNPTATESELRVDELLPGPEVRRRLLGSAVEHIEQFYQTIDRRRVTSRADSETIQAFLDSVDFEQPHEPERLVDQVATHLGDWQTHTPHPRYYGLFNPAPSIHGVVADLLVAGFNPQLGAWHHSPFGTQLEAHLLRYFAQQFGLPKTSFGHFTSGGSEANFTSVVVALSRAFPNYIQQGVRGLAGQPTLYCSEEFHHSFVKIAHQCGLGRNAVRQIPVTEAGVMDVSQLSQAIRLDRESGDLPFLIVATAGTTNAGRVEPIAEIAQVAQQQQMHLHVDAAWGGAVILSDQHRDKLRGIELADSITFDPHKLLSVPMGAGMILVREQPWLQQSFGLHTDYVPLSETEELDNYRRSFQFSRRFIGLKLYLTLASVGRQGYGRAIDHQLEMAVRLAAKLEGQGFRVLNEASLGVVCFQPPEHWGFKQHEQFDQLASRVCDSGEAWISTTRYRGESVMRACITNHLTRDHDLDALVGTIIKHGP